MISAYQDSRLESEIMILLKQGPLTSIDSSDLYGPQNDSIFMKMYQRSSSFKTCSHISAIYGHGLVSELATQGSELSKFLASENSKFQLPS